MIQTDSTGTWVAEGDGYRLVSLSPTGVAATLNAVLGVWPLDDAANAVGLTPADLVAEAEAWAMAAQGDVDPLQYNVI
jgi:hypothetical protein